MIAIDNLLVSDALVEEQFICDLHKCKGGCCVDGDAGAPLEEDELEDEDLLGAATLAKMSPRVVEDDEELEEELDEEE